MTGTKPPDDFPSFRRRTPEAALALAAPVTDERQLRDRSLVRGVAWNGLVKVLVQAVAWGSTLVVARLLSPDDYGVVGMATFFLGLVELITEFGIGITVAIRTDLTDRQIEELNSVSVGLGLIGVIVICVSAPWVGQFFHDARLARVVMCLSVTFFLSSLRSVPWGLLQRDLRFKRLAIYDGLQALALAALSVVLATLGFGYWTLVIAAIASAGFTAALALIRHPVAFRRPDFRRLAGLLSFSGNIVGQRIAWYGYSNADFVVAGKMLGSGPLGSYTLAWNLSRVTDKVTSLVLQVTPPVLAKVRDDHLELRRYVIRITEVMSLTVMPLMIGLALVAHDFVPLVLGEKWSATVFPLQVLSAYAGVSVALPLFAQVLNVTGHESYCMRHNFLQMAIMPCLFAVGAHFGGVNGIALAWIIGHPFLAARLARYSMRTIHLRPASYLRDAVAPSAFSCLLMAGAVLATRVSWPSPGPTAGRLAAEILVGAVVYGAALLIMFRSRITGIRTFVQQMLRVKREQIAGA